MNQDSMNAIKHGETQAHMRQFTGVSVSKAPVLPTPAPGPTHLITAKKTAMSAITNVQVLAQIGLLKLTGGIVAYAGRIREMDRERQGGRTSKGRDGLNRD
jgi:hypothetical protein